MAGDVWRTLLAVVLLSAAAGKLWSWREMAAHVAEVLRMGRKSSSALLAATATAEVTIGAGLLVPRATSAAALAAFLLLALLSGFIALQLRAVKSTACNCWGTAPSSRALAVDDAPIAPQPDRETYVDLLRPTFYAVRNASFCLLALLTLENAAGFDLPMWAAATPVALIVAGLVGSIAAELGKLRRSVHPRYDALAPYLAPLVILEYYRQRLGTSARPNA